jgi:uncharacterized protein
LTLNDLTAIQILCTAIKEKFDVNRVYIFGSKARGDDKQYSDINLLILTQNERTKDDRWKLSDLSSDISIDYGFALYCLYFNQEDWARGININPYLKANIEKDNIEIVL